MAVDKTFTAGVKALTGVDSPDFLDFLRAVWPAVLGESAMGEGVVAGSASGVNEVQKADEVEEGGE